ncbi:hypothetical protein B0J12DRAFT_143135 [Macrophomina phaseolina]|uniref:FAS1 domain-containing protein n=1 Tax=Macrophomina phaseolina TaxID=35725 RepID=A0ABQ8G8I9_9PEZI|nr:hypothetical protein B0J12DRAFT_143135 [Macrophomina phaseolina]
MVSLITSPPRSLPLLTVEQASLISFACNLLVLAKLCTDLSPKQPRARLNAKPIRQTTNTGCRARSHHFLSRAARSVGKGSEGTSRPWHLCQQLSRRREATANESAKRMHPDTTIVKESDVVHVLDGHLASPLAETCIKLSKPTLLHIINLVNVSIPQKKKVPKLYCSLALLMSP